VAGLLEFDERGGNLLQVAGDGRPGRGRNGGGDVPPRNDADARFISA
jgi:hypothetical protein